MIELKMLIDIHLALIGVVNFVTLLIFAGTAYRLYRLYFSGQNGITLWMAHREFALGLVWMWSVSQSIKNLSALGYESDFDLLRLMSLSARLIIGIWLLIALLRYLMYISREV